MSSGWKGRTKDWKRFEKAIERKWKRKQTQAGPVCRLTSGWKGRLRAAHSGAPQPRVRHLKPMTYSFFVSSTFVDLERHRQLVRDSVERLEHDTKAMEFFGALPNTPKDECLRLVRSTNAYIGIFGMRYGSIDPETGKSLSQLEYEEAQLVRNPSLIYLIDEEAHPVLPKHVDTGESAIRLRALKDHLRTTHVVNLFTSPEDLVSKVTQDIVRLTGAISKRPTADTLAKIAANVVSRHPLTNERFEFLKSRIEGAFPNPVPDFILKEALEVMIAGDNLAAGLILSRAVPMPLDDAVDGMMKIDKELEKVMKDYRRGIQRQSDV